jgi:hypothetical protein
VKRHAVAILRHLAKVIVVRRAACLTFACANAVSQLVYAAPADLNLGISALNRIIRGAQIPINSGVFNDAPNGASTVPVTGTRAADGGADYDPFTYTFNSAGAPFGPNHFSVTASGQAGTLHSPRSVGLDVQVLNHVFPAQWINGKEIDIRETSVPVQEPSVDPLAFGATGGGESAALAAPGILGDPLVPTANLDLDSISWTGSDKITTDLAPIHNVIADDNPSAGIPWQIFIKRTVPGHFEKTFTLKFSDEDIPGGLPPDSMTARLFVFFDVYSDGSGTGGLVPLYVPEPGSMSLTAALSFLHLRRRRRV